MDDLPVKQQKSILSLKTLEFYLKLLLLLQNVIHNQSLIQQCHIMTEVGRFPNFTAETGSLFFFKLPIPANPGHVRHYQLSLADGDGTLPHWMVFRQHTSSLSGLALTEDCGKYRLKVSVTGEKCAAHFYLHIRNRTVTDKNPARDTQSCSEGETIIWANLLLQLNPVTLNGSQRIRLVSTMADYLRLLHHYVSLFSQIESISLKQEKLWVCRQGGLAEGQHAIGDVAELLWPVGCQEREREFDLAKVLENSMKTGNLASLLGAPVLGWRVLCGAGAVQRKVKRDLQKQRFTPTPNMIVPPPTRAQQSGKLSDIYALPLKMEPGFSSILLHHVGTKLEQAHTQDSTGNTAISASFDRQADTLPHSFEKFTCEGHAFKTLMYQSDVNPEIPIQRHPTSFFSVDQTNFYTYRTSINSLLERQGSADKMVLTTDSYPKEISIHNCQQHKQQTGHSASKVKPLVEAIGCTEQVSMVLFLTSELPKLVSTVRHFVHTMLDLETCALSRLLASCRPHSIYPSLPLTPASYSVTATLTSEAVDSKSPATRLTLRPHRRESPLWTESDTANHTDSESQPTVSSHGHGVSNQEPNKDHNTATSALHIGPSVSHLLSENYDDVLLQSATLKTMQPLQSSNKIPPTQLFTDVSPYLMTEQLTQHSDTIQNLSPSPSGMNQGVMSQLKVTTQDVSLTTLTGQTELESSLSASLLFSLEPSVTTITPALPSELDVFSRQRETLDNTNPVFTVESVKVSSSLTSLLQTFPISSPLDTKVSPLQQTLESEDLKSKSVTEVCFAQTGLTRTLSSGSKPLSLLPTYLSWALPVSLPSSNPPKIVSVPSAFKDQSFTENLSSKSNSGCMKVIPSMEQTLIWTLLLEKSQQIEKFSNISFITRMTTSTFLNTTLLTIFPPVLKTASVSHPLSLFWTTRPVSEGDFDPTAPSTAEEPYTTSSSLQSLEPSFPLCGKAVAQHVSGCPPLIKRTSLENTLEYTVAFWTSSPYRTYATDFPRQLFSTETHSLVENLSLRPTSLPSGVVFQEHTESNEYVSLLLVSTEDLSASSVNLPPKVFQSLPALMATVGFPFRYSIPPKTFVDPEDGEAGALSLEMRLIDGPPVSVGTWLALDGLELHGVPLEVDLRFAPQDLLLVARDSRGLSTWLPLTLDLRRSPVDPCHVFTLTAQRSLHSMLLHRHRVELLLRKLSSFFNTSSSHHLSVVSMTPGSTVVSWYNYSLCETRQIGVIRCHVDQIRSMWLAMRSADESVNRAFKEAMLPEFIITKVGAVTFRPDCFSTSPAPTFGSSTSAVTPGRGTSTPLSPSSNTNVSASQWMDSYQWMAGMFTALLIVCILILIVLLVAVVLYFCRGRSRSRAVAIWPASRLLSVQGRDLTAIRPRRPPLLQPEPPPPPLRLWINLSHGERQLPSDYK